MIVGIGLVAWVIMVVGAVVAGMLMFPNFTMLRRPACMGTAVLMLMGMGVCVHVRVDQISVLVLVAVPMGVVVGMAVPVFGFLAKE